MRKFRDMSKTQKIIFYSVLAIVAISLYTRREKIMEAFRGGGDTKGAGAFVQTVKVRNDSTIAEKIVQNMSIDALKRTTLTARVTARLVRLLARKGDYVRKGQLLAVLEHSQQTAAVGAARAQVVASQADSAVARARMTNARTDLDRYEKLVKEGFYTQQQLEAKRTEYTAYAANYNASRAKERQVAAELNKDISAESDYSIYAPMSGKILNHYDLTEGAMISTASNVFDIADISVFKATLQVAEKHIMSIKKGMPVILKFDAFGDKEFQARVLAIDEYIEPNTRTSKVEIILDNNRDANGLLRAGMFGTATILLKEYSNVVTIPKSAVHESENGFYVWVVSNGRVQMREVKKGIEDGEIVQITGGLVGGEEIVTVGGNNLSPNDSVSVTQK
ncbi:MAG: efflux RND transporter periplasmic adaptor subunit [Synergistaceae bacterium]|nr:efflux RND transporter periplasmic adaptor subunit [Synergistaceae bacterium]